MGWKPRDITETELALLRLLWARGPSTIRELRDELYPERTHAQYTTVQSLLDRLHEKRCVAREKSGRLNVFSATVSRGEMITRRLRETADSLCGGSLAPLLSHLVDQADLDDEELAALDRLVDRLDGEADGGSHS